MATRYGYEDGKVDDIAVEKPLTTGEARVLVGRLETEFTVNIKTICDKSVFFAKTYNGDFKNGICKEIWCPFVPTAIFSFFVTWCNSGLDALQQEGLKWLDLFKLWVAADFLLAPKLQNDIMEIFHRIFTKERLGWPLDDDFNFFSINYVYNNTYPGSQLRRLVCDMVVYSNNICPFYDTRHLFNPKFLSEPQLAHLKWYQDQYGRDAPVAEYPSYCHVSEARLVRGSGEGLQVVRQE